ncbi:hypothetical protein [Shewanella colwelliana]|uniref:hypothetical protein n=1 Tax=Shewanella colwelliana TaxID=23 RepID=UPI0022AF7D33|nr:hypothetical protein [Shewanella colwelliana]MCZ4339646.1 hypothetical protein [Shewanella colwelliana]
MPGGGGGEVDSDNNEVLNSNPVENVQTATIPVDINSASEVSLEQAALFSILVVLLVLFYLKFKK